MNCCLLPPDGALVAARELAQDLNMSADKMVFADEFAVCALRRGVRVDVSRASPTMNLWHAQPRIFELFLSSCTVLIDEAVIPLN